MKFIVNQFLTTDVEKGGNILGVIHKNVYKANGKVFINNRNKIQMGIKRQIWPSLFHIVTMPV